MNTLVHRLLFTKKVTIGKDLMGNAIEIEGVFFNRLGRTTCLWWLVSAGRLSSCWPPGASDARHYQGPCGHAGGRALHLRLATVTHERL